MEKEELAALLDWMQAMHQGWRATNTVWLDLTRSLKNYSAEKKFALDTQGVGNRMDAAENLLRQTLARLNQPPTPSE